MSSVQPGPASPRRLCLLGVPRVVLADSASEVFLSRKDAALLAYLALEGPQAPQRLWGLLWPDKSTVQAGNNLRRRATDLSRAAQGPMLVLGSPVRLAELEVDAHQLPDCSDAELCNLGGLMDGIDLGDLNELDRWRSAARERSEEQIARRLAERADTLQAAGRIDEALTLVLHLTRRQPLDESAWQRLMTLHYLNGNRALALEAYWAFNQKVREEQGSAPGLGLQQLLQNIEAAEQPPPAARRPTPLSLQHPPVLVGRESAWAAMESAWQQPQAFLLVADAGMGKSRLLEEFVRARQGVLLERAQPGEAGIPFSLLGRLLVELDQRHQPALEALKRSELARLRPEFGHAPTSPAVTPALWQAAEALIAAALERGLSSIVIDDLHNADEASIEALRWLASSIRLKRLSIGLATRPTWAAESLLSAWLLDSQRPLRIDLRPLTADELTRFVASLALPSLVDRQMCERLYRTAGGHPLYTLAMLKATLAQGDDLRSAEWPRPHGIEALLDARVRELPPAARELLHVAAVAGADFSAELAAHVLARPVMALEVTWRMLEAAGVLEGASFTHDLMHEAALRALPKGIAQALHRAIAAWLAEAAHPAPVRVAWHLEHGERAAQAGRWWDAAGEAARRSGRLGEQISMFERAAACHALAGHASARFESAFARLPALRLRHGGSAVLEALPSAEAMADTREQRLRCQLSRAEALLDLERSREALADTLVATEECKLHPAWRSPAYALHAYALAQCGNDEEARTAAAQALHAADAAGDGSQRLLALNATYFVHYSAGRLAEAVDWLRQAVVQAETLGDRAAAASAEGNVAALLAAIGDVPATHAHALRCRTRHASIGLAERSTMGVVNHIVLGAAAAALGRFDEALDALHTAVAQSPEGTAAGARAKARLILAGVWLNLGRPELASRQVELLPIDILPGLRMQAALVRAQAAAQVGASPHRHFDTLLELAHRHPAPRLVQSAWFEWSYAEADTQQVLAKLTEVREMCETLGLAGTARSLRWRQLARALEWSDEQATACALEHAMALEPYAVTGLSAKCHPPRTLGHVAEAFRRSGRADSAERCITKAFDWLDQAIPAVPEQWRESFLAADPIHRAWAAARRTP